MSSFAKPVRFVLLTIASFLIALGLCHAQSDWRTHVIEHGEPGNLAGAARLASDGEKFLLTWFTSADDGLPGQVNYSVGRDHFDAKWHQPYIGLRPGAALPLRSLNSTLVLRDGAGGRGFYLDDLVAGILSNQVLGFSRPKSWPALHLALAEKDHELYLVSCFKQTRESSYRLAVECIRAGRVEFSLVGAMALWPDVCTKGGETLVSYQEYYSGTRLADSQRRLAVDRVEPEGFIRIFDDSSSESAGLRSRIAYDPDSDTLYVSYVDAPARVIRLIEWKNGDKQVHTLESGGAFHYDLLIIAAKPWLIYTDYDHGAVKAAVFMAGQFRTRTLTEFSDRGLQPVGEIEAALLNDGTVAVLTAAIDQENRGVVLLTGRL